MAAQRTSLEHRSYESIYVWRETVIDAPAEKVWPHALNIGGWMTAHRLESLAGEAGKVGHFERVWPRDLDKDTPHPRYHLYGVAAIVPHRYIALEVMPEAGGSYGITREWMSFDGIFLNECGGKTRVMFHMIDAHLGKGDKDFHAKRKQEIDTFMDEHMVKFFENLKRLVSGG